MFYGSGVIILVTIVIETQRFMNRDDPRCDATRLSTVLGGFEKPGRTLSTTRSMAQDGSEPGGTEQIGILPTT